MEGRVKISTIQRVVHLVVEDESVCLFNEAERNTMRRTTRRVGDNREIT